MHLIGQKLGILDSLTRLGSRPVSGASVAAFRIAFGLLGVAAVIRFAAKGWISDLYIEPAHHFLSETWVAYAMSIGGVLFDLTIVGWLLWSRSRPLAYAVLCAFHVATWLLFPIGMFPWIMICASLVFFSPGWARPLIGRFDLSGKGRADSESHHVFHPSLTTRIATAALLTFAIVQVIVPLRHWAYPGNVRWNEDGYRFSWRVMLTEKTGHVQYRVTDVDTGREWLAHPEDYLTPLQTERMAYQPDMILALAHIIAEDASERGQQVEVRTDSFVAFNGRPAARFVDPDVDLASVPPGVGPTSWVLPQPP